MDFHYLTPVTFHRYRHHGYYSTGVVYYVSDLAIAFYGNKSLHIYLVLTVSVFLFMIHIIPEVTVWNYRIIPQLTIHIFSAWWLTNLHWGICIHKQMLIFGQSPSPIKGLYYRYISIFIERFGNSVCRLESFIFLRYFLGTSKTLVLPYYGRSLILVNPLFAMVLVVLHKIIRHFLCTNTKSTWVWNSIKIFLCPFCINNSKSFLNISNLCSLFLHHFRFLYQDLKLLLSFYL